MVYFGMRVFLQKIDDSTLNGPTRYAAWKWLMDGAARRVEELQVFRPVVRINLTGVKRGKPNR